MDTDAIKFLDSLPTPLPVMLSRAFVGAGFFAFLIGVYVLQARHRVERANRELQHLYAAHDPPGTLARALPFVRIRRARKTTRPAPERIAA